MKYLFFAFILLLALATPAAAQEPTPTPFNMPYNFQPVDYESGPENPTLTGLGEMIISIDFMNRFGSIAVTVWSMLDGFGGGGVLGYFVIILLGVVVIKWIAGFVYSKPIAEKLDLSQAVDTVGQFNTKFGSSGRKITNLIKNRPRF